MFAKLKGVIDFIDDDNIILDVQGVGYQVYVTKQLLEKIVVNNDVALYIQTQVKEDAITLYGFSDLEEKRMFNLLLTVQGIGAKLALVALSKFALPKLQVAILQGNTELLKSIPGVGAKVAQRLATELKDKVSKISNVADTINKFANDINVTDNNILQDVTVALKGLGYNTFEINKILPSLQELITDKDSSEVALKHALKLMTKGLK